jgi:acetate kinase
MSILVINAGSASLKFALFNSETLTEQTRGKIDCIGPGFTQCLIDFNGKEERVPLENHTQAVKYALELLKKQGAIQETTDIIAVGHRVVHGGEAYQQPTPITPEVVATIEELADLAPLHNPPNVEGIRACQKLFPTIPHIAVFDTAFHQTIPKEAFLYGLPMELYETYRIRKYGFHGINHQHIAKQTATLLGSPNKKIISCHLGNGSSVTAIANGKSVDTSMGFTPLDGVIMGTRSGSLDPEIIFYLLRKKKMTPDQLESVLMNKSGLFGISGHSDMRKLRELYKKEDVTATLTINILAYRITKYIGSYAAVLNGIDAIVFTGGIGEHDPITRQLVLEHFAYLGVEIDHAGNEQNTEQITTAQSKLPVFIIKANEEYEIALETKQKIQ